ncbi:MAG: ribosomal protein L7/L12 [Acinetobacter sp.]
MTNIPPEAIQALQEGQMIKAIKIIREKTGLGLKESKDLIELYLQNHPQEQLRLKTQLAQRSRSGIKLLVAIIFFLAILMWFFVK